MKMKNDCIPCICRQTLEGARMATDNEDVVREIIDERVTWKVCRQKIERFSFC